MSATIDPPTLKELQDAAGAEFVAGLVDTFLEEAPRMLKDLEASLAARDAERFRRAAHSLKSNSQTFGALKLAAQAKDLELGGLDHAARGDAAALVSLSQEYARVVAALEELRDA
jgi:HPt (histidine-containing phosphotransfer) domain-containing protein